MKSYYEIIAHPRAPLQIVIFTKEPPLAASQATDAPWRLLGRVATRYAAEHESTSYFCGAHDGHQ